MGDGRGTSALWCGVVRDGRVCSVQPVCVWWATLYRFVYLLSGCSGGAVQKHACTHTHEQVHTHTHSGSWPMIMSRNISAEVTCWPNLHATVWVSAPAGHGHGFSGRKQSLGTGHCCWLGSAFWMTLEAQILSDLRQVGKENGGSSFHLFLHLFCRASSTHEDPTTLLQWALALWATDKSLFIGISSNLTIPELHLNQLRERRGREEVPPALVLEKQLTTSFIW